jgi:hypothetical protein
MEQASPAIRGFGVRDGRDRDEAQGQPEPHATPPFALSRGETLESVCAAEPNANHRTTSI